MSSLMLIGANALMQDGATLPSAGRQQSGS